jgi:putative ABC transport system substrate-binding protein
MWPLAAPAQQAAMPVIGFLSSVSPDRFENLVAGFHQGLREAGYVDGHNVKIEYRWAHGRYDHLPELATDLVRRQVAFIAATGSPNSAQSAKAATTTIPIVFANGGDPVEDGIVSSLNRPGGNITGVTFFSNVLAAKRLEVLREIKRVPLVAVMVNQNNARAKTDIQEVEQAANAVGQQVIILNATNDAEIELAFDMATQKQVGALLINADGFLRTRTERLVALALRHTLPAIYSAREWTVAGGLMSYGASIADAYRQAGSYAARILNGARPAELPVTQPTTFELIINLKTAKALGLEISPTLLTRADEVIE